MAENTHEHRKAEVALDAATEALRASEAKYRSLFENSRDAIMTLDPVSGIFTCCNPATMKIFGAGTLAEFVSLGLANLSPERQPDGRLSAEKVRELIATAMRAGSHFFEWTHRRLNGEEFFANILLTRIDQGGKPTLLATVRDITERKRVEDALRESEAKYRGLFERIHSGFLLLEVICDSDGNPVDHRLLEANAEFEIQTGLKREDEIGRTSAELTFKWPKEVATRYYHTAMTGEPFQWERYNESLNRYYDVRVFSHRRGQFGLLLNDITAEKRAEEALRMSEEKFSKAFHSSPVGMTLSTKKEGRYLDVNAVFLHLLQRTREEVIGHTAVEVGVWSDSEQRAKLVSNLQADGKLHNIEATWHTKSGQTRVVLMSGVEVGIGGADCLLGSVLDITERKQAEQALRVREEQLRLYAEHSPVAVAMLDRNMKYIVASRRWMEDFRLGNQDLVGRSHYEVFPEIPARWLEIHKRCLAGAVEKCDEDEFPRADGSADWIRWEIQPWHLADGSIGGVIIFSEDITKRKRVEDSHARLATVVEQASETIVITDTHGTILYANPAFEKTTGYTCAEAIGQNPRILKSGKQDGEFYRQMWEVLERGEVWHGHFHNRRKDGSLYEEDATISPVRDNAGKIVSYVAVKRDVTREALLERQFLQSQKMESVGQLAGGVAHDFNNMLAATMMHLGLLQKNEKLDAEARETINELIEGSKRAANLTRQLLMFSRRSILEVKLLDLNELVTNLLKMLGRLIGENIVVRFDRREGLPAIEADPGMIEQVIVNLAVNARDAMPGGGKLAIGLEAVQVDAQRIAGRPGLRPGRFLRLSVSDTGCGMDEATRQRIFEPFFTTKDAGKGTGLGLATVDGIVAQHKGWVEVESEVGKGSTFKVFLPASAQKMPEERQAAKTASPRGHETILVVEDESSVRRLVALNLRKLGYAVFEVENGQAAMNLWQQRRGEFDLLFSDMVMPEGLTGLDLAEKLKKEKPGLKVIISSGYSAEIAGQSKLAADGIFYLQKPYRIDTLAKTVRDCLDGKAEA